MGWLGWTEEQALKTDVNCILIAMEGKLEMLYPQIVAEKEKRGTMSARFKTFVSEHNTQIKKEQ